MATGDIYTGDFASYSDHTDVNYDPYQSLDIVHEPSEFPRDNIRVAQWDTSSGTATREYTYSDKEFREALDRIDRQQMDWDRVVMDGIAPIGPPPIASRMKVVKNRLDEIISEIEAVL